MTEVAHTYHLPAVFPHDIAETCEISTSVKEGATTSPLLPFPTASAASSAAKTDGLLLSSCKAVRSKHSKHCEICDRSFATVRNLARHMCNKHGIKDQRDTKNHSRPISCSACVFKSASIKEYVCHLNIQHERNLNIQTLCFNNESNFEQWKRDISRSYRVDFVTHRGKVKNRGPFVIERFYCSRSKFPKVRATGANRKRTARLQGTRKIGGSCSAFIFAKVCNETGTVAVECCLQHHDHDPDPRHLQLPPEVRSHVAAKLGAGVPVADIVSDVSRRCVDGTVAKPACTLSRKDVHNIRRQMNARHLQSLYPEQGASPGVGHVVLATSALQNIDSDSDRLRASIQEHVNFILDFVQHSANAPLFGFVQRNLKTVVTLLKGQEQTIVQDEPRFVKSERLNLNDERIQIFTEKDDLSADGS